MAPDPLETYRAKRDFGRTAEPEGADRAEGGGASFVVQKHAARRLHYDVRFEVEGVMPSWAVPKGPSYDPTVKRLAVHVEDHPLDYQHFEGVIPAGEYGGGSVIVWDAGTYRNMTERNGRPVPMREAIDRGHVSVWLEGQKLHGGWSLTRTAKRGDRQDSWIMVKRKDEYADAKLDVAAASPGSVKTGRQVEEVSGSRGEEDTWTRGRATWLPPMLAELSKAAPPDPSAWVFERKYDGLRAVAVRNGDDVELWSRGHQSFTGRFPRIVAALRALPIDNFTVDGEIVAVENGRSSFELLQRPGSTARPVYEIFDVLHLLGRDATDLPLTERHRLVARLVEPTDVLRPVETLTGDPADLLAQACRDGWEGIIAKRADAPYRSGRSSEWRKLKCDARQELVVGGWTDPRGTREHLGALLVGYYDAAGDLRYAGKVGTGFDRATLEELHQQLTRRERKTPAFVDAPRMRDAHWVRPDLVANIAFTEWTADGKLRHPRFQGLRPDKDARQVTREAPAAP